MEWLLAFLWLCSVGTAYCFGRMDECLARLEKAIDKAIKEQK